MHHVLIIRQPYLHKMTWRAKLGLCALSLTYVSQRTKWGKVNEPWPTTVIRQMKRSCVRTVPTVDELTSYLCNCTVCGWTTPRTHNKVHLNSPHHELWIRLSPLKFSEKHVFVHGVPSAGIMYTAYRHNIMLYVNIPELQPDEFLNSFTHTVFSTQRENVWYSLW